MHKRKTGKVRIIAGRWRGRRLEVADKPGLRPTGDRIRETLFSWLAPVLSGARCLDLFAGTGALGLEAASRGAAKVTLVERDRELAAALNAHVQALDAAAVIRVVQADAMTWLRGPGEPYDIIFLDPPFGEYAFGTTITALESGQWLNVSTTLYLEMSSRDSSPTLPVGWQFIREKTAGGVRFCLARHDHCA